MTDYMLSQPAYEILNASRVKRLPIGQSLELSRKNEKWRVPMNTPNQVSL